MKYLFFLLLMVVAGFQLNAQQQQPCVEEGIIDREIVLDHNLPSGVYLIKLYEGQDMRHGKVVIH